MTEKEYQKQYRKKHKEKIRKYMRVYMKKRRRIKMQVIAIKKREYERSN